MARSKGLAILLEVAEGDASSLATTAASVAAAAVALPYISYSIRPSSFSAHALSLPPRSKPELAKNSHGHTELKSVISTFHPVNLIKVFVKNVGIHCLIKFNAYMVELLDNERKAIDAEERGEPAPEPPPFPDLTPAVKTGVFGFCREIMIATTRRIYEHVAVWKLPRHRAEALLRDSRAWIRDVLVLQCARDPVHTRFIKYKFATLHATALFYAADCTVAIGIHTYRTYHKSNKDTKGKVVFWCKGVGLQALRCSVALITASSGAALGSLAKPGLGTTLGQVGMDVMTNNIMGVVINGILSD